MGYGRRMNRSLLSLLVLVLTAGTVSCSDDDAPAFNYDRDLQIDGLSAPVGAHFDEYGVLHLECQTDEDCFAAEGYFHASHRLFQMERLSTDLSSSIQWVV